jgi:hypothetical protein
MPWSDQNGFVQHLSEIVGKIDYLLTFALVKYGKMTVEKRLSAADGAYMALVVALVSGFVLQLRTGKSVLQTARSLHRVSCILLVDNMMQYVSEVGRANMSVFATSQHLVVTTALLLLVPTFADLLPDETIQSETVRLAFFIYAENASFLTQDLEVDRVIPALAIILVCMLQNASNSKILQTVCKGLSMLMSNALITVLLATKGITSDEAVQIAWLLCVSTMLQYFVYAIPGIIDLQEYTTWKVSSLLTNRLIYLRIERETIVVGSLLIAFWMYTIGIQIQKAFYHETNDSDEEKDSKRQSAHGSQSAHGRQSNNTTSMHRYGAITAICFLTSFNTIMQCVTDTLHYLPNHVVWVALLSILNLFEVLLQTLQLRQSTMLSEQKKGT